MNQEGHPIAYYSKKLKHTQLRYSNYDRKFYAVMQTVRHWRHYLLPHEFILYSDHEALRFLNSQKKLNPRHGRWVEFLQAYTFVLKHKAGVENKAADALSRRTFLLVAMSVEATGFERIREEYASCPDFGEIIPY